MNAATLTAAVVVGNPKPASRTSAAAAAVAERVLRDAGDDLGAVEVIELAPLGAGLFGWGDPAVAAAKSIVLDADLVIVASPVYKASFTGLLKAFLDQFGRDELAAVATAPVMVGAGEAHALAIEQQLRPVLIEIGASCPTRGLYVLERELEELPARIDDWLAVWGDALTAVLTARRQRRLSAA